MMKLPCALWQKARLHAHYTIDTLGDRDQEQQSSSHVQPNGKSIESTDRRVMHAAQSLAPLTASASGSAYSP
jgi:hypothetical protein